METKSPASTNGALLLTRSDQLIRVLITRSNVNLLGYTPEEDQPQFEMVQLEWEVNAHRLTHPSATAAYAVFRTDCIQMGIPPISFAAWLKSATAYVEQELTKEAHHLEKVSQPS